MVVINYRAALGGYSATVTDGITLGQRQVILSSPERDTPLVGSSPNSAARGPYHRRLEEWAPGYNYRSDCWFYRLVGELAHEDVARAYVAGLNGDPAGMRYDGRALLTSPERLPGTHRMVELPGSLGRFERVLLHHNTDTDEMFLQLIQPWPS